MPRQMARKIADMIETLDPHMTKIKTAWEADLARLKTEIALALRGGGLNIWIEFWKLWKASLKSWLITVQRSWML
jgi:hypothetical protein